MTGYVADPLFIEGFREYFDMFDDDQVEDDFLNFLPQYLHSCKCFEERHYFLEAFADKLEKDIEVLDAQIQSHSFNYQNQFLENLFLPKQEKEVLPFDIKIEEYFENKDEFDNSQLNLWFDIENTSKKFNHDDPVTKYFEDQQTDHVFIDPVADYMEGFFSLNFQPCFQCGNKMYYQFPLLLDFLVSILLKHNQTTILVEQLLDWLHWHFSII
jgi:hypothetical protein